MEKQFIITTAIENLNKYPGIKADWEDMPNKEMDGRIMIEFAGKKTKLNFQVKQELRQHQIDHLAKMALGHRPYMILARYIFPKIKDELRQKNIAYLEANGNMYLQDKGTIIWLEAQKPMQKEREKTGNRAFTKTGLKVVFLFLLNEDFINLPYREIAARAEVGLGNINYVMNGLKEMGFLIKLTKDRYKLNNKKELLDKWIAAYGERLKPALKIGTFRFLKDEDFTNWKKLPLRNSKTYWGGEPAGDLFTDYLRPAELTLYSTETRNDLIKNYRLLPDENGHVKAYQKFWNYDEVNDNVVPPLLVYADLINTNDRRCTETAQKIYDELLQNKL
ncbi:MAG: hypothetical protein JST58_04965 [Bacteroidetes bacterium]|nr:hypothetical protein [Bacteroidota bacterium]